MRFSPFPAKRGVLGIVVVLGYLKGLYSTFWVDACKARVDQAIASGSLRALAPDLLAQLNNADRIARKQARRSGIHYLSSTLPVIRKQALLCFLFF